MNSNARIFAMFPHMHYLGRKQTLELGSDANSLNTIINGRVQPPPEPDRAASSLLGNVVTKISPPPEPD